MIRALVAFAATLCLFTEGGVAQPVECGISDQCQSGFFCVHFKCLKCINCESYNREPPLIPTHCIKSEDECGSCVKGSVKEWTQNLKVECVRSDIHSDESSVPYYVWWVTGVVVVAVIVVAALVAFCVLRNKSFDDPTLKILTSLRTSVPSCVRSSEPPPPYDAPHASAPARADLDDLQHAEELSYPFISRESAGRQKARVFNNPHYVRGPHLPGSNSGANSMETPGDGYVFAPDDGYPFTHDEDTMESTWTPHEDDNGNQNNTSSIAEAASGTSTDVVGAHDSSSAVACVLGRQDTNNNRNANEPRGSADSNGNTAINNGTAVFINFNINTLAQQNVQK